MPTAGDTLLSDKTSSQKASNGPKQLQYHVCWKWKRLEVMLYNGKFSQRRVGVLISGRQRFYTWPEHIGNSSWSSSVLTPVKEMEEGKRKHFCLQFEEGDTQLWKSAGLLGGVSTMEQMSQSQRLKVQSHLTFFFLFGAGGGCWVWRQYSGALVDLLKLGCAVTSKTTTIAHIIQSTVGGRMEGCIYLCNNLEDRVT